MQSVNVLITIGLGTLGFKEVLAVYQKEKSYFLFALVSKLGRDCSGGVKYIERKAAKASEVLSALHITSKGQMTVQLNCLTNLVCHNYQCPIHLVQNAPKKKDKAQSIVWQQQMRKSRIVRAYS